MTASPALTSLGIMTAGGVVGFACGWLASRRRERSDDAPQGAPAAPEVEHAQQRIEELEKALAHEKVKRADDRTGRIRAEAKLREAELAKNPGAVKGASPIGYVRSCFVDRRGTPRQGTLVPSARGYIELLASAQPGDTLDGLEAYSHVWVLFGFHLNTNLASQKQMAQTKVRPPRLGGQQKLGIFATRTPHRPNPIGLSLAKLERVDRKTGRVFLSGIDLIDATPVLDIKPYIPSHDTPHPKDVRLPDFWVHTEPAFNSVALTDAAERELKEIVEEGKLRFFSSAEQVASCIREVLSDDIRSYHQKGKEAPLPEPPGQDADGRFFFRLDRLDVRYEIIAGSDADKPSVLVLRIRLSA